MKLKLDYRTVRNNVLTNVLPYLEHIETKEIMMNMVTMDMAKDMNNMHTWINTILLGSGLCLIGSAPIISFMGITGATAIALSAVNFYTIYKENRGFVELKVMLMAFLHSVRHVDKTEFEETMKNITTEDMIEFLEKSVYFNLK